jgi:hypothetical protein
MKIFSHEEVIVISALGELEHQSNEGLLDICAVQVSY